MVHKLRTKPICVQYLLKLEILLELDEFETTDISLTYLFLAIVLDKTMFIELKQKH